MHLLRPSIFICCLLSLFGLSAPSQGAETIRIAVGHFPPFLSESLPGQGTAAQLIREAFAIKGIEVVFVFLPWPRAFSETQNGQFDATAIWLKRPERENKF